jgi:predicted ATP-grasp superfamily ATP-dependent carboligase
MKILVICNNSRSITCSGRRAGYEIFALDNFKDMDNCAERAELIADMSERGLYRLASSFGGVDAVIKGPGFEKLKFENMLTNRPEVIEETSDKLKIERRLRSMGIPAPETAPLNKAAGLKFPLMLKPRIGSGGMKNVMARNAQELDSFREKYNEHNQNEFIAQEFIEGVPCSASIIGTGDDAEVIALNEQLIGISWLTRLPFAYCGNITPFNTKFGNEMIKYAKQIAVEWKLVGSNGVDFILSQRGVFAIEINPRFQGSIDTVELATGINIFDSHVKSFTGELPELRKPSCFAAKAILFADRDIVIDQNTSNMLVQCMNTGRAADIPQPGCAIRADEPVTTLLETAKTRKSAFEKVRKSAQLNLKRIRYKYELCQL